MKEQGEENNEKRIVRVKEARGDTEKLGNRGDKEETIR